MLTRIEMEKRGPRWKTDGLKRRRPLQTAGEGGVMQRSDASDSGYCSIAMLVAFCLGDTNSDCFESHVTSVIPAKNDNGINPTVAAGVG